MPTPRQHATAAARYKAYRERKAQASREALQAKGLPPQSPLPAMPSPARWKAMLQRASSAVEALQDELQEYHDERSPEWQEGDRAEAMLAAIERLEGAAVELDSVDL